MSISVVRDTAKYIGMAVANLATMFDPEVVVLGGSIASSGDIMLEAIRTETHAPPDAAAVRSGAHRAVDARRRCDRDRRGPRRRMIALSGADLVLPDRVVRGGSIVIDQGRIAAIEPRAIDAGAGRTVIDLSNHTIVPGFVDVHVHGVEGIDVLDGADAVADVAKRLPKYGVTAFCPTSVACAPARLTTLLDGVARARSAPAAAASARVLPAHLESNFINPEWNGAQPMHCLRTYKPQGKRPEGDFAGARDPAGDRVASRRASASSRWRRKWPAASIWSAIWCWPGHRVSLGHTGATYDAGARGDRRGRASCDASLQPHVVDHVAIAGRRRRRARIRCGHRRDHLRRPPRASVAGRDGDSRQVGVANDGDHRRHRGGGTAAGSRARLGDQTIIAGEKTAVLEDGTLAGSILTMDAAFRMLVTRIGLSLPDAARMCATTPAEAMKAADIGAIAAGNGRISPS